MQTQPNTPNHINFLEIVDDSIVYSIGNNVYQVEIDQDDLEFVFGVKERYDEDWVTGSSSYDLAPVIESLNEVHESDYVKLITACISKAEDITDSYEGPITPFEKELTRVINLSNQQEVKDALQALMFAQRRANEGYSFELVFS